MPIPVQSMASKRGNLDRRNICKSSLSPENRAPIFKSRTPINSEITDVTSNRLPNMIVDKCFLM